MVIGIDGSRAFLAQRTGIEEYSYQVIKNLRDHLNDHQIVLYVRKGQASNVESLKLPENWTVKEINWPRFWTQMGLSLEMLFNPVDALFVPAHTVPFFHPKKSIVVIHGLEYEFCPNAYSLWERIYMRSSIKMSCRWAKTIISVSNNTKQDLISLYGVNKDKIAVIYEGYDKSNQQSVISNQKDVNGYKLPVTCYLLFLGRIEERKNVANIINAFEILKEKYQIPHKLVLAGKPGYGYENFKFQISNFKFKDEVLELGFVSEEEKWELLKNANVFVFPTLYEGFGIPILEAQSVGCPVVASNNSSIKEVTQYSLLPLGEGAQRADEGNSNSVLPSPPTPLPDGEGGLMCSAILTDPKNPQEIADAVWKILFNDQKRKDLIEKGKKNVERFSWEKCASEISKILGD